MNKSKYHSSIEQTIDMATPDSLEYVGNYQYAVCLADGRRKYPDFISRKDNRIVELYGDYWHKNDDPEDIIADYQTVGYSCLVIWEHELKDMQAVLDKISRFLEIDSWQITLPIFTEEDAREKRRVVSLALSPEELAIVERLCKHHKMNRSELIRYLILKEAESALS